MTWCVGRIKVLEAETATTNAAIRGSTPVEAAMLIASGTSKTVAPTLDTTRVNTEVSIPMSVNNKIGEIFPTKSRSQIAINSAVPEVWVAMPSGISPASKNTVRQSTA